jgi:hypothetical protein
MDEMTLAEFKSANPGITSIGGEGRWLVVWCGSRATRYDSYHLARADSIGVCSNPSCNKTEHTIIDIANQQAAPVHISKSWRRMVEAD